MTTPEALQECEWSRIELVQALKNQISANSQANDLDVKLKALRGERYIARQTANAAHTSVGKAFKDYAATACRTLCDGIMTTFSRDVRDMIYSHLYLEHTLVASSDYFDSCVVSSQYDTPAHLWMPEVIGRIMHRELCEHFFRFNTFQSACGFTHLARFRTTDQWSLGYVPADFSTNIEVHVTCEEYDLDKMSKDERKAKARHSCSNHPDPWGDNTWGDGDNFGARSRSELLMDLDCMSGFATGTKLTIKVYPECEWCEDPPEKQERTSMSFVPFVLPTMRRLKAQGYPVSSRLKRPRWYDEDEDFVQEGDVSHESYSAAFAEYKVAALERQAQREQEDKLDADSENEDE